MQVPHYICWREGDRRQYELIDAPLVRFFLRNLGRSVRHRDGRTFILWCIDPYVDTHTGDVQSFTIEANTTLDGFCSRFLRGAR